MSTTQESGEEGGERSDDPRASALGLPLPAWIGFGCHGVVSPCSVIVLPEGGEARDGPHEAVPLRLSIAIKQTGNRVSKQPRRLEANITRALVSLRAFEPVVSE